MILIISIDQDDTTTQVIRWLSYYGIPFCRINEYDLIDAIDWDLNSNKISLRFNNRLIHFHEITAYWYRKGNFKFDQTIEKLVESKLSKETELLLQFEHKATIRSLHQQLSTIKGLSNYNLSKVNKLEVLQIAQHHGLLIPATRILSDRSKLCAFIAEKGEVITKVLDSPMEYYRDTFWLPNYTEALDLEKANALPEKFGPSLFQERVEKEYEVRTVFLHGKCYSMAIFSQSDQQTTVDFRHYNFQKPNRTVPFLLPDAEQKKLRKLMADLGLDFGSVDFMVDKEGQYIFLEVNPVGQFGMTSYPCNYHLEKAVAEFLISA